MKAHELVELAHAIKARAHADNGLSTCAPFRLSESLVADPAESFLLGVTEGLWPVEAHCIAGMLVGAGYLTPEMGPTSKAADSISAETLLLGVTEGLCPPDLVASYYVVADLNPSVGLLAHYRPDTAAAYAVRTYVASLVEGADFRAAVADLRGMLGPNAFISGREPHPVAIGLAKDETAHKVARELYRATRRELS